MDIFGTKKKKKIRELQKLIEELRDHVWYNAGFRDDEGSYKSPSDEIQAQWGKYHNIIYRYYDLKYNR